MIKEDDLERMIIHFGEKLFFPITDRRIPCDVLVMT